MEHSAVVTAEREPADYEPLDLSGLCNAGIDVLGGRSIDAGHRTFHGLPFQIGDPEDLDAPAFLVVEPGAPEGHATHHHGEAGHRSVLERPFLQARERLQARLDEAGG